MYKRIKKRLQAYKVMSGPIVFFSSLFKYRFNILESVSQSEEWANQRSALLRKHIQELKNHTAHQRQARNELVSKHQAEKDRMHQRYNAVQWANYLTLYVKHLTNLSIDGQQRWQIMRTRQEQENAALEERISAERE